MNNRESNLKSWADWAHENIKPVVIYVIDNSLYCICKSIYLADCYAIAAISDNPENSNFVWLDEFCDPITSIERACLEILGELHGESMKYLELEYEDLAPRPRGLK